MEAHLVRSEEKAVDQSVLESQSRLQRAFAVLCCRRLRDAYLSVNDENDEMMK